MAAGLLACVAAFGLMRLLATTPLIDATWQATARGQLTLVATHRAELRPHVGRTLDLITARELPPLQADELLLQRTARWLVSDAQRQRYLQHQDHLARLLARGEVELIFTDGTAVALATPARGYSALGLPFWPLMALALLLSLAGAGVALLKPNLRNAMYATIALSQAVNLMLIAAESTRGVGQPEGFAAVEVLVRMAMDLVTALAALCTYTRYPRRVPGARTIELAALAVTLLWLALAWAGWVPHLWLTTQALVIGLGTAGFVVLDRTWRQQPDPFTNVMRRFTALCAATLLLFSVTLVAVQPMGGDTANLASIAAVIWTVFLAAVVLWLPFLSSQRRLLREFALLAGIGTVVTSLGLLVVALLELGPLASLGLAVGVSLAVYVAARQWILTQVMGASALTTERTFEQLYRTVREAQAQPERTAPALAALLQELFEPQETMTLPRRLPEARVMSAGTALYVPIPGENGPQDLNQVLVMRHAGHGQRLFTLDDARLAERLVEQVRRALALDHAVEQGRAEERQRIAQDLHDDIGARLLTLMYKAQDREIEEYLRHTLQDLKTLTRGLAASEHRLSHAAAEWKSDMAQRLDAARLQLDWRFEADAEPRLSVVQWSALTRILRELVSNVIAHAGASRVAVELRLAGGRLSLAVSDDGRGGDPQAWTHGLGLGGVRKRVRTLEGRVQWKPNEPQGIRCEVEVPLVPAAPLSPPAP